MSRLLALGGALLGAALLLLLGHMALDVAALTQPLRAFATGGATGIITHTTTADFTSGCTTRTNLSVLGFNGGEVRLQPTIEDYFDGPTINESVWLTGTVVEQGGTLSPTIVAGQLRLNGNFVRSQLPFTTSTQSGRFFEANVLLRTSTTLSATNSDLGFARENRPFDPFSTDTASRVFFGLYNPPAVNDLRVRLRDGNNVETDFDITPDPDLLTNRLLRLEWEPAETRYYVDGSLAATLSSSNVLTAWVWLYSHNPALFGLSEVVVDWVRAGAYPASGTLVSCQLDASGVVNWSTLNAATVLPASTAVTFRTRTSVDGTTWSAWQAVSGATIASPSGRYFQYEATLSTSTPMRSPELQEVVIRHYGPTEVRVSPNPATVNPGATQTFTPLAYDANNQPVTGLTYTLALVNGGGSFNPATGVFTAQLPAGTFNNTISATLLTVGGPLNGWASITIPDLPPTALTTGPYTVNEAASLALSGSGSDPNGAGASYAWDLDNDGSFETPGASVNNIWPDNGTYIVGFRVRENGGAQQSTIVTTTVTVNNVAPTISSVTSNASPVNEGTSVTITVSASDPAGPVADPLQYEFDCDNSGGYEIGPQSGNAAQCLMSDNPSRTVNVRVSDGDGGSDTDSVTVTVSNVAPSLNSISDNGPRAEGSVLTITLNATDPAGPADPLVYEFDCNNNGSYEISQATNAGGCTFFEQGAYVVPVRVNDGDGGVVTGTRTVTVTNAPPQISSVTNSGPIAEGGSALITINATDPAGANDPLQYEFDCDGNTIYEIGPQAGNTANCTFGDNGARTVRVRVTDDDGGSTTGTTTVTVNNVAPTIHGVQVSSPRVVNEPVTLTIIAADPAGANDPLQYSIDCNNDGTFEVGPQLGSSSVCVFSERRLYLVPVRVTDGDGGVTITSISINVDTVRVYLPLILKSTP